MNIVRKARPLLVLGLAASLLMGASTEACDEKSSAVCKPDSFKVDSKQPGKGFLCSKDGTQWIPVNRPVSETHPF